MSLVEEGGPLTMHREGLRGGFGEVANETSLRWIWRRRVTEGRKGAWSREEPAFRKGED